MSFDKSLYPGYTEGPFGVPMTDAQAKAVEEATKDFPSSECEFKRAFASVKFSNELREDERADISILTTATVDRDFEVVIPKGVDLSAFKSNPVVTFAHRYDMLPVGKAAWTLYNKHLDAIKSKTLYEAKPDGWSENWLPDAIYSMVKSGTLQGKSIGFVPLPGGVSAPTPDELSSRPEMKSVRRVFRKVLMFEYAVAPVPSNPQALAEAVGKGIVSTEDLERMGLEVPEPVAEPEPEPERERIVVKTKEPEPEPTPVEPEPESEPEPVMLEPKSYRTEHAYRKAVLRPILGRLQKRRIEQLVCDQLDVARGRV